MLTSALFVFHSAQLNNPDSYHNVANNVSPKIFRIHNVQWALTFDIENPKMLDQSVPCSHANRRKLKIQGRRSLLEERIQERKSMPSWKTWYVCVQASKLIIINMRYPFSVSAQKAKRNLVLHEKRRSAIRRCVVSRVLVAEERCECVCIGSEHQETTGWDNLCADIRWASVGHDRSWSGRIPRNERVQGIIALFYWYFLRSRE